MGAIVMELDEAKRPSRPPRNFCASDVESGHYNGLRFSCAVVIK